ncbi:MAG: hypothetical protein U1B79_01215 [Candidatus Pacearchaeota archaeon]|nr:hypothetical protein [Nanoarchaeota archaeon]MDZ4226710.1 hypothetical protein [Candidatus Pacearchaeota archaeon]
MEGWESDPDAWKKEYEKPVRVRGRLDWDLESAQEWIDYLNENQDENYAIKNPDYLNPEMREDAEPLPMNHVLGAFMYFRKIKEVLKKAKETGYISEDDLPIGAPQHLERMVKR